MHFDLTCNTLKQKDPGVDNTAGMKENSHPPGSLWTQAVTADENE